jgi:hypothetical protein
MFGLLYLKGDGSAAEDITRIIVGSINLQHASSK